MQSKYNCDHHSGTTGMTTLKDDIQFKGYFTLYFLKGLAQAKIIKKSVILFWLLDMTI